MRGVYFLVLILLLLTKTNVTPGGLSMGATEPKMQSNFFQLIFRVLIVWVISQTRGTLTTGYRNQVLSLNG